MRKKIQFIILIFNMMIANITIAQSLILDTTFNSDGIVVHPVGIINDEIRAIALRPDGKIVAAGVSYNSSPSMICALAQYLPDGTLDTSFAGNGHFTDWYGQLSCIWQAVALQQDSSIVVTGFARDTATFKDHFGLARYHSNGTVDSTFGSNGKLMTNFFGSHNLSRSIIIQNDGKIVVGGTTVDTLFNEYMAIARYNNDGSLDTTFSNDGKLAIDFNIDASSTSMTVQTDGKFVLCGSVDITNNISNLALARVNTDGTLDTTFGVGGKQIITTNYSLSGEDVTIQPDGKIAVCGIAIIPSPYYDFAVIRLLPDGDADTTFSNDGIETTAFGSFIDYAHAIALQPDGKIIVGGATSLTGLQNDMALARYNTNGSLDTAFGIGGKMIIPVSAGYETINALQFQPDGKLIAGGFSELNGQRQFTLLRFMNDLSTGLIEFDNAKNNLLVYPNPIQQQATLKYELKSDEIISISLIDLQGRKVKTLCRDLQQNAGEHSLTLELGDEIKPGYYVLQLANQTSQVSIRIIKQ